MATIRSPIALRRPDEYHPALTKWFHILHPRASWRKRKRGDAVKAAFVDRFFDDRAEFDRYEAEFFDGPIVDICRRAMDAAPDGMSIYDAHEDECARLYALIRKYEPESIVETGVYHGVSTASMLLGLHENERGTLHSIHYTPSTTPRSDNGDHFERGRPSCSEPGSGKLPPGMDPGWIIPETLHDRWRLRRGRSRQVLPRLLPELEGVDLFVHDSEHSTTGMLFEFELAWERLVPGGMLVSFHVDWNDAFDTFVDERSAEHGRMTYTYSRKTNHSTPCSSGYVIRI